MRTRAQSTTGAFMAFTTTNAAKSLLIEGCTFQNMRGFGVIVLFAASAGSVTISGSIITNTFSPEGPGAVYVGDSTGAFTISDSTFRSTTGGAVTAERASSVTVRRTTFDRCTVPETFETVTVDGGAALRIRLPASGLPTPPRVDIEECTFVGSGVPAGIGVAFRGGAVQIITPGFSIANNAVATISRSTFASCSSGQGGGVGASARAQRSIRAHARPRPPSMRSQSMPPLQPEPSSCATLRRRSLDRTRSQASAG